ncbi:spore germination protein [Scytonema hofmannii PCC 7110]|uniref:Spore germination protein n=1 Tax=Scytonema hofmannii PCC 7110 TaxID=128403 RepID=A0A139WUD6_9CYAN|nr:GerMN domain-containing protein [Scytonema hofmannii]KYC36042.1 spore germination protein [Scytonema hofmannii PCC 7110]
MKEQQGNRISSGIIAAISVAVIAVSGAIAYYALNPEKGVISKPNPGVTQQPNSNTQITNEQKVEVYWLQDNGTKLSLVPQAVTLPQGEPDQVIEAAFSKLLAGPTEGTDSTTIPTETKLLGVKVGDDGVHVNLSEDFTTGGGSSSMMGRVGQVVYTATSLNPNAKVYIEVNGKQLDVLGGEGLELEQPLTRESYKQNFEL